MSLWKRMFWTERQMSAEYGPTPATVYRHELAGLSDEDVIRYGAQIISDAQAKARRTPAGAAR